MAESVRRNFPHNMADQNRCKVVAAALFFFIVPLCALVFGFANLEDRDSSNVGEYLVVSGIAYLVGTILGSINVYCCGQESCMTGDHFVVAILFNLVCIVVGVAILVRVADSCLECHPLLWGIGFAFVVYAWFCLSCAAAYWANKR